jgi:hypothetical protein
MKNNEQFRNKHTNLKFLQKKKYHKSCKHNTAHSENENTPEMYTAKQTKNPNDKKTHQQIPEEFLFIIFMIMQLVSKRL